VLVPGRGKKSGYEKGGVVVGIAGANEKSVGGGAGPCLRGISDGEMVTETGVRNRREGGEGIHLGGGGKCLRSVRHPLKKKPSGPLTLSLRIDREKQGRGEVRMATAHEKNPTDRYFIDKEFGEAGDRLIPQRRVWGKRAGGGFDEKAS